MSILSEGLVSKSLMVAFLAFIPTHSFSAPVAFSKYASVQYHGEFSDSIGEFKGKEDATGSVTEKVMGYYNKDNVIGIYRPEYKPGFAGSIAFGYSINSPEVPGNFRVELEGLYSQVNTRDDGYVEKGDKDHKKEALATRVMLVRDAATSNVNNDNASWAVNIRTQAQAAQGQDEYRAAFKMTNEGFNNIAGMVNFYYDVVRENNPITPYIGIGGGLTRIEHLKATEYAFAYQGKVGISYTIAPNAKFLIGYRFFNRFGDKFNKVKPLVQIEGGAPRVASTTATIENKFSVMGLEAGLILNF